MEFGMVGLEGFVGSDTNLAGVATLSSSDPETKPKWYGSGFLKQDRSGTDEDDWRGSKLSKTESMPFVQRNGSLKYSSLFADGQQPQQMLSFSCSKSEPEKIPPHPPLPYFHLTSAYNRNTGYNSGSFISSGSMHGLFSDAKGPFTQSQWMELEHQALIYKYITANVPIPSQLLIPIRKAADSVGFSSFPGGFPRHNTLTWGGFHLGFSSNTDPEPGRCRRTDGKKWRCSRDAVADQKYCERHMNRGRHRSRKPVEGQTGHSATATVTSTIGAKSATAVTSTSTPVVGPRSGDGPTNSVTIAQHHLPTISSSNGSSANPISRKSITEEFGLVTSDSLLNPQQKSSSLISGRNYGSSQNGSDQENVSQSSLRQFMDDWPKNQYDRSAGSWPELDMQSDRTQLSISIPMAPSDFMFSNSSPNNEKTALSPLRLSRELDPIPMGLGVGTVLNEPNQRQASWIPISWETSMGGPLGEVLHNTTNGAAECKNSSALNLMLEGWDSSPRLNTSPTGVLQKASFGSLSNSSAGQSPAAENKNSEGASLCNDLLGPALVHSASMPAL
ncbi:hypothetical protein K2173_028456 [Erythroxylum novogranatense]|uniref:Growth-regulating factor n=1 Tax=Erythroxylum novogranatense TaxID=1862640 RepID=A0AAV8U592_9ROSI|nr:hypothetical protein K2173_028456 [Erythroxylum novogranatense]